jgi:hypothetical protein
MDTYNLDISSMFSFSMSTSLMANGIKTIDLPSGTLLTVKDVSAQKSSKMSRFIQAD